MALEGAPAGENPTFALVDPPTGVTLENGVIKATAEAVAGTDVKVTVSYAGKNEEIGRAHV